MIRTSRFFIMATALLLGLFISLISISSFAQTHYDTWTDADYWAEGASYAAQNAPAATPQASNGRYDKNARKPYKRLASPCRYDKNFIGFTYNYAFFFDSSTKGDLADSTTSYNMIPDNGSFKYGYSPFTQIMIGHRYTSWLSLAIAFEHMTVSLDTKNDILQSNPVNTSVTEAINGTLNITTALVKSFIQLGRGFHFYRIKFNPFADVGIGLAHVRLSNMSEFRYDSSIFPHSKTNFAFEVGLGLKNCIARHLNLIYGINYTYLGSYETSNGYSGDTTGGVTSLKQAVSASLGALAPYVGLTYSF
jgi:opacity protein-like surface antigen